MENFRAKIRAAKALNPHRGVECCDSYLRIESFLWPGNGHDTCDGAKLDLTQI